MSWFLGSFAILFVLWSCTLLYIMFVRPHAASLRALNNENAIFGCDDVAAVRVVQSTPFARGFSKSVWLTNNRRFVWKKPVAATFRSEQQRRAEFVQGVQRELKMYSVLVNETQSLAQVRGVCIDAAAEIERVGIFVEGPLARWRVAVDNDDLHWCVRMKMARQILELLDAFERRRVVHCDWKTDQVALSKAGDLKLVDLKSLKWSQGGKPIGGDRQCRGDQDCRAEQCFRWQLLDKRFKTPDLRCDTAAGKCIGIDSLSMVFATKQLFFDRLLTGDGYPLSLTSDLKYWMSKMVALDKRKRVSVRKLLQKWQQFDDTFHFEQCAQDHAAETAAIMKEVIEKMRNTAHQRCDPSKRFC